MNVNNPRLTTNLNFTVTTDKNGTQVRCADLIDTNRCRDVIDTNKVIYISSMNSDLFLYIIDVIRSSFYMISLNISSTVTTSAYPNTLYKLRLCILHYR